MRRHEKLYRIDKEIDDDESSIAVYLNDCRVLIQKLSGLVARRDHRIEVPPRGAQNHEAAQRIENALRWMRDYVNLRWQEGIHNPLPYDQAQSLLLRGWITERIILNADDPTFVDEALVDPIEVYPRKAGNRITRVSHVYTCSLGEVLEEFPEARERYEGLDDRRQVEVHAYYENEWPYWHAVEAEGEWVKEPAKLEYWPWIVMVAKGSFSDHATELATKEEAKAEIGQGFLDCIEDIYGYLNQLVTMGMNTIGKEENPPAVVFTQGGVVKTISLKTGARTVFAAGEDFKVVQVGANEQRIQHLLSAFQDRMNKGGIPAAMFGEGASLESGYMSALMMGAAQDTLWTYIKGLEAFHRVRYGKFLELFRDFATQSMPFVSKANTPGAGLGAARRSWGEALTVDDVIKNGVYVDVVYEDITPQDRVALANIAKMLVDAKLISLETARGKFLNLDDPTLENDKVLADQVNLSPEVVKALSALNLRRLGRLHELAALNEATPPPQPGAGGGSPGFPPGMPPMGPGEPPPGMPPQIPPELMAMLAQQGGPPAPQHPLPAPAANPLLDALSSGMAPQFPMPPPSMPGLGGQVDPGLLMMLLQQGGGGPPPPSPMDIVTAGGVPPQLLGALAGGEPGGGLPGMGGAPNPLMGGLPGQMPGVGINPMMLPVGMQSGGGPNVDQLLASLAARGLRP